jgi:hypothetical protein
MRDISVIWITIFKACNDEKQKDKKPYIYGVVGPVVYSEIRNIDWSKIYKFMHVKTNK